MNYSEAEIVAYGETAVPWPLVALQLPTAWSPSVQSHKGNLGLR